MGETKVGIQNLSVLLVFAIHFANVGDRVTHVGTSWAEKLAGLFELLPDAAMISSVNFAALQAEVSDLDDVEKAQLNQIIKEKFNLADDKLEAAIEGGISILLKLEGLVKESAALVQNLKAA